MSRIALQAARFKESDLSTGPLAGLRILIVEDEFLIAMDVEQLCRDNGASDVTIFANVADPALQSDDLAYDAAIIDVMVDGGPTIEFARRLRGGGIPFIFATGYSEREEIFAEFPNVMVVGKPYSGGDIVDALARAITAASSGSYA